ncbi:MAG TPA: lipase, partial [Crocinitomicaceae bacterium]|nr:lipase [Crocinitomicaceae bacterium]
KTYNNVYLHYTDATTKCGFKVYQNGNLIVTDSLKADGKYHVYPLNFPNHAGKLRLEFEAKVSPNILGFSLEGDVGVQVDNIAMRGSSGTFFGKIDQGLAKRIYTEQNVELFIMQFGGNSMPYIKDSSTARKSAEYFKGQLYTIKKLCPNASIIVIGPSDMSTLIEGEYTTYPILPYFVECLRRSTKDVGGAYFDMYEAMGGKDAMVAWVESGLAAKDYIHFSNKGASIAAQKFYDALMTAYTKLLSE